MITLEKLVLMIQRWTGAFDSVFGEKKKKGRISHRRKKMRIACGSEKQEPIILS